MAHDDDFDLELEAWLDSLESVISHHDENRTVKILAALERRAEELGVKHSPLPYTA